MSAKTPPKVTGSFDEVAESWRASVNSTLAKRPERRTEFKTVTGTALERCYLPLGLSVETQQHYMNEIGFPGKFPFTRGVQSTMYRGQHWTMRQYAGFGTAEETNARYRFLLAQGTTGLSVAFDLPTQMGFDSDSPRALGEVGRVGVAIDTVADIETLFEGIPLADVSTSMTINATAAVLLAFYLVLAKRRGIAWSGLRGTIQNDVLKEYIARGTYIYPPVPALRIVTDIFEFCSREVPGWNTISISGYHIREAGANAAQEVAFTLADGIAYVDAAIKRGLAVDDFAPRLAFFFACHNEFLEEIAKFRAARRMWARIMRQRFGATSDRSCMLRFHTQTAGSSLTAQQPEVNIVRTTIQALAAVLGGTQSLHTNSFDEALCLPTEHAAQLALRTQQVIAHESGVSDVVDPLGGSPCIEALTDAIEQRAQESLDRIENAGGMVRAIELGLPQREIEDSSYRYQQEIERKERIIVGVNRFESPADASSAGEMLRVDPALELRQRERLAEVKSSRDSANVAAAIAAIEQRCRSGENLMPAICHAAEAYVSIGEISDALRRVFGEYRG